MGTDDTTYDGEESSPFTSQAEYDATAADVFEELIEVWVVAPMKVIWNDIRGRFGILIIAIYLLMGTVGVAFWPTPSLSQAPRLVQPFENMRYPLGTDAFGQDLLGLMIHSTPAMLKMILSGAIFGGVMGIAVGLVAGYMGGTVDKVLMTVTDTFGSIPGLPLLLILVALIEPTNPWLVGIVLNIQGWAGGSRGIRGQTLALRNKEYVEASRSMGQSTSNVLFKEILPELMPMIVIGFLGGATSIISASVGLYFLGILPYSTQNWGVVLNQAYMQSGALYSLEAAHWLLVPLFTITFLNFGFVLLAQSLDQVFNPRVRARHEARKQSADDGPQGPQNDEFADDAATQVGVQ
ncbi:peptide/nickel transport system permease protein [Natronoarchaeum philippinense]|uniref:Peptide/nickel transport system permease protein n=1 Tax=Natronoarchaeum philippinense TaxID=558529 RepID=A0A285PA97_NATPI|nr:ABC transporter permease [Natronoarchaeum philippinense]SNZ17056.1 peptide/nickel transport system permease protein [Natronoarchaeum philippinense]